jgi:catecholate siderophore receptor
MLVEHKFNDRFTFRNRTRYAIYDKFYQNVFANSGIRPTGLVDIAAYNNQTDRENFFNQTDLLFSFNTGWLKHELVTGFELGRQVTDNIRRTGLSNPANFNSTVIDTVSPNNPITAAPITFITRPADQNFHSSTSIAGVYIQDQITILPQLQAILGVRYDRFEVDFRRRDGTAPTLATRDDLISPRFGLVFKPIEPVSIYGSYSLAYVPRAGDQLTSINVTNQALDPERFINIEGGIKWDIRPNLAFTTAFYQLDRTNVIFQDPNNAALTFLGKGQRVRGVEAGISGKVTSAWSIMGGYAYQEGVLSGNQANSGNTVAELPRHSFSLWNRYDFTPMWGAAFGVIGRSNMFAAVDNAVVLPDFVRVDAALYGKLTRNIRAQVNIENLFDVNYIAAAHNNNNILPGSPIAARAMIIANF